MKRFSFVIALCLIFNGFLHAKVINDGQIIPPESQIYEDFLKLQSNSKLFIFTNNTPLSVRELKFYLKQYDYDNLDEYGQYLYDKLYDQLYEKEDLFPNFQDFHFTLHPQLNLEFYYKTRKDIPWGFEYYFKDNIISAPLNIGYGDNVAMGANFFLGKNHIAAGRNDNFCNFPLNITEKFDPLDVEFYFPTFAYASFGKTFENWGYNLQAGKQGKTIGQTLSGSIIYNKTFETDAYFELDLFTPVVKFTMDVVQVSSNRMDIIQQGSNTERYLYIHQFDIRFFKKLKFSIMEGSLVVNPFSLRFLNPLPFMHQFGGWLNYSTDENKNIYRETNFCADFAYMLEYVPVTNLRLYAIYNQIEMQLPYERGNSWGRYYPNSIGLQAGADYSLFFNNNASLNFAAEFVYNSPYMYIKQTPSASLYKFRIDMQTKGKVYSWIGSPYGPDCLGGIFNVEYSHPDFKIGLGYIILAHGQNDLTIFDSMTDDKQYYDYYPSVEYKLRKEGYTTDEDEDQLFKKAISLKLSGIKQITNSIAVNGSYYINEKFELNGRVLFNYILNSNHQKNNNVFGVEFDIAFTYKIL